MTSMCFFHQSTGLPNQYHLFQHFCNLFLSLQININILESLKKVILYFESSPWAHSIQAWFLDKKYWKIKFSVKSFRTWILIWICNKYSQWSEDGLYKLLLIENIFICRKHLFFANILQLGTISRKINSPSMSYGSKKPLTVDLLLNRGNHLQVTEG